MNQTATNGGTGDITVSVCIQTYQHVEYIGQCIESILQQKTTFPFEIIIGEDESTDGTRQICTEYAEQHPGKIRLFLRSRKDVLYINGKPTGRFNFIENLKSAQGKYIAICEGDDYWTDSQKLQKQFELMEKNIDYGICFHKVAEVNTFDPSQSKNIPDIGENTIYEIKDYILSNKTATCSMFFRKELFFPVPAWFNKLPFGDLGIILLIMSRSNGKGIVLNDLMGVYRIHPKGIHGSMKKDSKSVINAYRQHLDFTRIAGNEFLTGAEYKEVINRKMINTLAILKNHYRENDSYIEFLKAFIGMYFYKVKNKLS